MSQILIVGSGPSGLVLALSLLRNGVPVRVIEKSTTHRVGQRGAGLMPRSIEIFESLGILDQVMARSIPLPAFKMYKMPEGVEVAKEFSASPHVDPTPSEPYLNPRILGQDNLDKIIRAELEKLGCFVELGMELKSLEQKEDRVRVQILKHDLNDEAAAPQEEEAEYKWVVGADGARGAVRKLLGLSYLGETTEQRMVTGDILVDGLSQEYWHVWGDITKLMISIRPSEREKLFNFIISGNNIDINEVAADHVLLKQLLKQGTGNREDIEWGNIICAWPYKVSVRMVDYFQKGRVFVAGDAAHIHSPTGGQGMNTGVQDAYNLAWKLALVANGKAPESLLDTYHEERHPVVSEMLSITTRLLKKTVTDGSSQEAWDRSGQVHQLGVNYRASPIVLDEDSERTGVDRAAGSRYTVEPGSPVHAGDRAPDASGLFVLGNEVCGPTRLFKLFNPTRHTVLIFSNRVEFTQEIGSLLATYSSDSVLAIVVIQTGETRPVPSTFSGIVVEDRCMFADSAYKGPSRTSGIFVIRPDGFVGARFGGVEGLQRYFQGVFKG
ncbi:monooxygenase [Agrocybe pediades]|nr:monooxygenase [Agrocybe pediades]